MNRLPDVAEQVLADPRREEAQRDGRRDPARQRTWHAASLRSREPSAAGPAAVLAACHEGFSRWSASRSTEVDAAPHNDRVRWLFRCGVIAGPLFVVAFLVHGALKPDYDPARHPVSSLALGLYGWVQTVNFIVVGLLIVAFAIGLATRPGVRRKLGAILVGIWGIGLVGAGVFVTDPVSGYPPGTPPMLEEYSTAGALHDLFSVPGFVALSAACLVLAWGEGWRWAVYSVLSGIGMFVAFAVSGVGFSQNAAVVDVAGVWQRVSVIIGFTWLTLLAMRARQ
jgi:hypothetical membrane protein